MIQNYPLASSAVNLSLYERIPFFYAFFYGYSRAVRLRRINAEHYERRRFKVCVQWPYFKFIRTPAPHV